MTYTTQSHNGNQTTMSHTPDTHFSNTIQPEPKPLSISLNIPLRLSSSEEILFTIEEVLAVHDHYITKANKLGTLASPDSRQRGSFWVHNYVPMHPIGCSGCTLQQSLFSKILSCHRPDQLLLRVWLDLPPEKLAASWRYLRANSSLFALFVLQIS